MLWIWPTTWMICRARAASAARPRSARSRRRRRRGRGPGRWHRPRRPAGCSPGCCWSARCALEGRDVAEQARHRHAADSVVTAVDTGVLPRSFSDATGLGRLHRDVVGNAGRRVGPEVRGHLLGRAQADIDVVGDGAGVEAELGCPRAVDLGVEGRCVDLLLEMGVDDARDGRDAPPQLLRDAQVGRPVVADRANVDLRRQAEVQDLGHHVGRLEVEDHLRERRPAAPAAACAHSPPSAHVLP